VKVNENFSVRSLGSPEFLYYRPGSFKLVAARSSVQITWQKTTIEVMVNVSAANFGRSGIGQEKSGLEMSAGHLRPGVLPMSDQMNSGEFIAVRSAKQHDFGFW
jgi:hypothetical protein